MEDALDGEPERVDSARKEDDGTGFGLGVPAGLPSPFVKRPAIVSVSCARVESAAYRSLELSGGWTWGRVETRPDNDEGQVRGLSVIAVTGRSLTLVWSVGQDQDTVQSRVTAEGAACAEGHSWADVSKAIDIFPLSGFLFGPFADLHSVASASPSPPDSWPSKLFINTNTVHYALRLSWQALSLLSHHHPQRTLITTLPLALPVFSLSNAFSASSNANSLSMMICSGTSVSFASSSHSFFISRITTS